MFRYFKCDGEEIHSGQVVRGEVTKVISEVT